MKRFKSRILEEVPHLTPEEVRTQVTRVPLYLRAGLRSIPGLWPKIKEAEFIFFASALSFSIILTVIPLFLLSASAVGIIFNSAESIEQLKAILDAAFPPQPFANSIKESILAAVSDLVIYRTSLGISGFIVLVVTATFLFDIVRQVLHKIYRIQRTRGLIASFFHDVGFVLIAFVLLLSTNVAVWIIRVAEGALARVPELRAILLPSFFKTLPTGAVILLTALMFYIVYRFLTDSKPPRAAAIASTITMTSLWLAAGKIFALYLSRFSLIGSLYGPYAFILVLLLWIYYSSLVFIFGAIVGEAFWEQLRELDKKEHHLKGVRER
jgi:membrane protein